MTGPIENVGGVQKGIEVPGPVQFIGAQTGMEAGREEVDCPVTPVSLPASYERSVQSPPTRGDIWRERFGRLHERVSGIVETFSDPDSYRARIRQFTPEGFYQQIPMRSRDIVRAAMVETNRLTDWFDEYAVDCHVFGAILAGGEVIPTRREAFVNDNLEHHFRVEREYERIDTVDESTLPTMQPLILARDDGRVMHTVVKLPHAGGVNLYIGKIGCDFGVKVSDLQTAAGDEYAATLVAPVESATIVRKDTGEVIMQYPAPTPAGNL